MRSFSLHSSFGSLVTKLSLVGTNQTKRCAPRESAGSPNRQLRCELCPNALARHSFEGGKTRARSRKSLTVLRNAPTCISTDPSNTSFRSGRTRRNDGPDQEFVFCSAVTIGDRRQVPAVRASSVPLSTCIHPSRCPTASALRVATEELPLYHRSVVRLAVNRCRLAHSRANVGLDLARRTLICAQLSPVGSAER